MKPILLLTLALLTTIPAVAQIHFYFNEPFKQPAKIPNALVPLIRKIAKSCRGETINQSTNIRSWFDASKISIHPSRSAFILRSTKSCLNGVDDDWFWIFVKSSQRYRLALTGGAIVLDVLKSKRHGLRSIETNAATANTNYKDVYEFDGAIYKRSRCMQSSPPGATARRVPCRTW
jgi:hypothetical protein